MGNSIRSWLVAQRNLPDLPNPVLRPRPTICHHGLTEHVRKTRAHVLADLGINHVERQVLLSGFSVERVQHDYGYDLVLSTFTNAGELEPGGVYIQVKATDRLPRLADARTISWPLSRRDLKLWLQETYPVILIVYDGDKDRAYWMHIQAYISQRGTAELFAGGETVTVRIPMRNRFNSGALREIARYKNDLQSRLRGKGRHA